MMCMQDVKGNAKNNRCKLLIIVTSSNTSPFMITESTSQVFVITAQAASVLKHGQILLEANSSKAEAKITSHLQKLGFQACSISSVWRVMTPIKSLEHWRLDQSWGFSSKGVSRLLVR